MIVSSMFGLVWPCLVRSWLHSHFHSLLHSPLAVPWPGVRSTLYWQSKETRCSWRRREKRVRNSQAVLCNISISFQHSRHSPQVCVWHISESFDMMLDSLQHGRQKKSGANQSLLWVLLLCFCPPFTIHPHFNPSVPTQAIFLPFGFSLHCWCCFQLWFKPCTMTYYLIFHRVSIHGKTTIQKWSTN